MKNKWIGLTVCLIVIITLAVFSNMPDEKQNNEDTAYYIIASNMLDKTGEFRKIDDSGKLINKEKIKIQDITKFSFDAGKFIAGGERANNNLIINGTGDYKIFSLLDNPNYSGVTSISISDNKIIAVMNGNVEEDTYKNLFIVQDEDGKILRKEIIDIYSSDLLSEGRIVYIVGANLSVKDDIWSSKIIKIDLDNYKIEEQIYEKDMEYKKIIIFEDKLYCLGTSTGGIQSNIDILNKKTLEKIGSINFNYELSAIFTMNNRLYCIINNKICEIKDKVLLDSEYMLPEDTFVSSYLSDNTSVYIYCRNENIYKENKKIHMGYIIKYDKGSEELASKIPVLLESKRYDNIIFFPVEYMDNSRK